MFTNASLEPRQLCRGESALSSTSESPSSESLSLETLRVESQRWRD
jgi:hypothetical protein